MGGFTTSSDKFGKYDFSSKKSVTGKTARDYAAQDNRIYTGSTAKGLIPKPGQNIHTESSIPLILVVDITGSMQSWPGMIFSKIAALYAESNVAIQGLGLKEAEAGTVEDLLEVAVLAVGDYQYDKFPIQVLDFKKGAELVKGVNEIYPEGGGGGNAKESYDLAVHYLLKHCETPNVPDEAKPIVVFAGDEGFYDTISCLAVIDIFGDQDLDRQTEDAIKELTKKFNVSILRPEPSPFYKPKYPMIQRQWEEALGVQVVHKMENPRRLVDCIIGICGQAADNYEGARELLKRRQTPNQVTSVDKTLREVYN